MKIKKLLEKISFELVLGSIEQDISGICYDSRNVRLHSCFFCIFGEEKDGHDYAQDAVRKGAKAVVAEHPLLLTGDITLLIVKDAREALAYASASFFHYPYEKLITIGITGTKGKTTTSYMIHKILSEAGIKSGLIGTVETRIGNKTWKNENTTPESFIIQKYLKKMADEDCRVCVMEVSSQGLKLHRTDGIFFDFGIFTNLEADHIGPREHKDFDEYVHCKSKLFRQCQLGIINSDDKWKEKVLENHSCSLEFYGCQETAKTKGEDLILLKEPGIFGIGFRCMIKAGKEDIIDVKIPIPGVFTMHNALAAIAVCRHFNIENETIQHALYKLSVKGRVEYVPVSQEYTVLIDYAHNAMSLKSLLCSIREYEPKRIICAFGCGGNRSKLRRYEMGEVSSKYADLTVVTSDNPRWENPDEIIDDILIGIKKGTGKYVRKKDRRDAVAFCKKEARPGDVIILAGKGHEDYQEINGIKYPMDDHTMIEEVWNEAEG